MSVSDPPSLRRAIGFYERAVALDSTFAPAWAQLSRARTSPLLQRRPRPGAGRAGAARGGARPPAQARTIRWSTAPSATTTRSSIRSTIERALAEYEQGLRLAPDNVDLLGRCGVDRAAPRPLGQRGRAARARGAARPALGQHRRAGWPTCYIFLRQLPRGRLRRRPGARARPDQSGDRVAEGAWSRSARGDLDSARAVIRAAARDRSTPRRCFAYLGDLPGSLLGAGRRPAAAGARAAAERLRQRPGDLGASSGPSSITSAGDRARAARLRRLGPARLRGADPGGARGRAAPRASRAGPGLPGPEGGGDAGRAARRRAAADQPGRATSAPTSSTSSCGSTCWSASRRRRSTSSSRCSGSRTTSRPAGSGSIPRSIRCGTTRGSRSWWRLQPPRLEGLRFGIAYGCTLTE